MSLLHLFSRTGAIAALLAFAVTANAASSSAQAWLENYYQQPAPERFSSAIYELSRSGYFEQEGHVPLAIGFIASVFQQHPDRVEGWLNVNRVLPVAHQRILVAALWYSGHAKGADYLRAYARSTSPALRSDIEALLANASPDLHAAAVHSDKSLNLQWGAFLATGDTAPVRNILSALAVTDNAELTQDVRWSLAQNAAQHQRVLAICRDELSRQPNAVRETLRAVINDTEVRQPSS